MENRIKELRESHGLTQEQLASKSGVSRATISALENGKSVDIKAGTLHKLAQALGVHVSDLLAVVV